MVVAIIVDVVAIIAWTFVAASPISHLLVLLLVVVVLRRSAACSKHLALKTSSLPALPTVSSVHATVS